MIKKSRGKNKMSVNSNKYIIQNMERLSFFDNATGACQFIVDDLQSAEMTNEQETCDSF
jgi:hypothetical protein